MTTQPGAAQRVEAHAPPARSSFRPKGPLRAYFLNPRREPGFDRYDAIVLAIYISILVFAIRHYLPFADEAQEWLIARDSSLLEILFRRMHYEGHPPLWSIVLWAVQRLHMPYTGINWMAGAFALPGVFVFLRWAPFPRVFRWLLPFTYFLQFQYAVVARPYILAPCLLFTLCILFGLNTPRPVMFALAAGLLANISLHTAIVAGVFCLLYLKELRRARNPAVPPRSLAAAAGCFGLLALIAALPAFPAPDAVVAYSPNKPLVGPKAALEKWVPEERLPSSAPPLDPPLDPDGLQAKADAAPKVNPVLQVAAATLVFGANAACYPIAESNLLAVAFLVALWLWLRQRGRLQLLLPFAVALVLSVHIFVYDHHTGIFLLSLIAAAWIAMQERANDHAGQSMRWLPLLFGAIALAVILLQIAWTWHCIRGEAQVASDPGRDTKDFLAQNFSGESIVGFGYQSVSIQPYATRNLFSNWPHAYYMWSANVLTDRRRTEALLLHPDGVVVSDVSVGDEIVLDQWLRLIPRGSRSYHQVIEFWQQHGYRETHRFCATEYRRLGVAYTLCDVVMEPAHPDRNHG